MTKHTANAEGFARFFKPGALDPQTSFMQTFIRRQLDKHSITLSNWVGDLVAENPDALLEAMGDAAVSAAIEDNNVRTVDAYGYDVVLKDDETLEDLIDINRTLEINGWKETGQPYGLVILSKEGRDVVVEDPEKHVRQTLDNPELDIERVEFYDDDRLLHSPDDREMLEALGIDASEHTPEVYQWFSVDDDLANRLESVGEIVLRDFKYGDTYIDGPFWGRTCCGQALNLDYCMHRIFAPLVDRAFYDAGRILAIPMSALSLSDSVAVKSNRLINEHGHLDALSPRLQDFIGELRKINLAYLFTYDTSLVDRDLWDNLDLGGSGGV